MFNLIVLEINGRRVSIGLFHFEYETPDRGFEHTRRYRRSTLADLNYTTSVESLASPRTITSEEELRLTSSAEKLQVRNAYPISPSPTYRTLDLSVARSRAPSLPSTLIPHQDEDTFIDLPASRNSTCTNLTLSSFPATPTSSAYHASIFASSQLAVRPLSVSDLPALPTSFQRQVGELEAIKHRSMMDASKSVRPALHNIINVNGKIRSSSAVPLASNNDDPFCGSDVVSENTRAVSLTEIIEKPPPAWCSSTKLKSMPLSADPAIKKLTELRRNSKLGFGFDRMSRRISLSGFEFGFGGSPRKMRSRVPDEEAAGGSKVAPDQHSSVADKDKGNISETGPQEPSSTLEMAKHESDQVEDAVDSPKKTIERKHPIRGASSGHSKRPAKSLSIMPPPVPDRARGHVRGQPTAGQGRNRRKSVVERGRYEKLSR